MTQIVYLSIANLSRPIGGVMVQAAHVAALARAGYDAKISTTFDGARPAWLDQSAVISDGRKLSVRPGDILVLHDSMPRHLFDRFVGLSLRRVFFCQNHHFIDRYLGPTERLSDFPIDAFICVSEPIAEFLREVHGVPDPVVIRPYIMHGKAPVTTKKLQVCYMPRKRAEDAAAIIEGIRQRHPEHADVAFVEIDDKGPEEVARIMAESQVFLSLSVKEGLGLPPLEAMQAECLVIGYHGGGGKDYATSANGIWFDRERPGALVQPLAEALSRLKQEPHGFRHMIEAGQRTAERYDKGTMERDLLGFWKDFLEREARSPE